MKHAMTFVCLLSTSCALTSKAKPVEIRWFSPEPADARVPTATSRDASTTGLPLCLGRISSSSFLRNRIVYRHSSQELRTYDDKRWTEYPEVFLRRSLTRTLFETGRFSETPGSTCPTLDVELLEFEEVHHGDERFGRVQVGYRLHVEPAAVMGTLTVESVAGAEIPALATAMGSALEGVSSSLADMVEKRLELATR